VNQHSSLQTSARIKFLADEMVGRLARWLRLLGYDTKYANGFTDSEILTIAESEGRTILTRDTLLTRQKRCRSYIFIKSDHWREQLKQVYVEAGLDCDAMLTRCVVCNFPLRPVDKQSVELLVPAYVFRTQEQFSQCENCSRIFWSATHVSRILDELKSLKKEL
jgi:uncharacterized protein with PIN domain